MNHKLPKKGFSPRNEVAQYIQKHNQSCKFAIIVSDDIPDRVMAKDACIFCSHIYAMYHVIACDLPLIRGKDAHIISLYIDYGLDDDIEHDIEPDALDQVLFRFYNMVD